MTEEITEYDKRSNKIELNIKIIEVIRAMKELKDFYVDNPI